MKLLALTTFFVFVVVGSAWTQALDILPTRQIVVEPTITPPATCTLTNKLHEQDDRFNDFNNLYVASRETVWSEKRANKDQIFQGPDREIVLKTLDLVNCEISFVTVRQHGTMLVSPAGWDIRMLERPNGIVFNAWNTAYQIVSPGNHIVLKNKFPKSKSKKVREQVKNKNGKVIRTAYVNEYSLDEYIIYSPYSPDLRQPLLVEAGRNYIASVSAEASKYLRERGVVSKTQPGVLIADLPQLPQEFFERLPLLEQTDLFEFNLDPQESIDRVYVIVGANERDAYNATCSSAGACGLVQYTKTTWNNMRKAYKSAKLDEFEIGVRDHVQSMMAAMLLYDDNLANLKRRYGARILSDPHVEEYLTAAYNGAPLWVTNSITASLRAKIVDWMDSLSPTRGGLRKETRGYMVKLREMHRLGVPLKTGE